MCCAGTQFKSKLKKRNCGRVHVNQKLFYRGFIISVLTTETSELSIKLNKYKHKTVLVTCVSSQSLLQHFVFFMIALIRY